MYYLYITRSGIANKVQSSILPPLTLDVQQDVGKYSYGQ